MVDGVSRPVRVIAVAMLTLGLMACATPSPTATPHTSASIAASPSPFPTPEVHDAQVIARIPLPHPNAQTTFGQQIAVTDEAIWIGDYFGEHLMRVDLATNRISADVAIEPPLLATGDGALWMLSPWGGAPGPPTMSLSRVDLETGATHLVAELPPAGGLAVGLGGVWLADGDLRLIDPASGSVIRRLPVFQFGISVACGELWSWDLSSAAAEMAWLLDRLDPLSGEVLEEIALPEGLTVGLVEIDGLCWTQTGSALFGIKPGEGLVIRTRDGSPQIVGDTVWHVTTRGRVQRLDPMTGSRSGPVWQLPQGDLHVDPKGGADWKLLSAGGSLWVLGGDEIVRYAVPTVP